MVWMYHGPGIQYHLSAWYYSVFSMASGSAARKKAENKTHPWKKVASSLLLLLPGLVDLVVMTPLFFFWLAQIEQEAKIADQKWQELADTQAVKEEIEQTSEKWNILFGYEFMWGRVEQAWIVRA
jgi:hypothetical protein